MIEVHEGAVDQYYLIGSTSFEWRGIQDQLKAIEWGYTDK